MSQPIVTPDSAVMRGQRTQVFTADQLVTWTASAGTISAGGLYTAPNVTGTYTVTARNAANETRSVTISVTAAIYRVPSYTYPVSEDKKVLRFEPESGPEQTRTKRGHKRRVEFNANDRQKAEVLEMRALWRAHYGIAGKYVYFTDPDLGEEALYKIDSLWKSERVRPNLYNYSFVLQEV